jgi:hypothetical protein
MPLESVWRRSSGNRLDRNIFLMKENPYISFVCSEHDLVICCELPYRLHLNRPVLPLIPVSSLERLSGFQGNFNRARHFFIFALICLLLQNALNYLKPLMNETLKAAECKDLFFLFQTHLSIGIYCIPFVRTC